MNDRLKTTRGGEKRVGKQKNPQCPNPRRPPEGKWEKNKIELSYTLTSGFHLVFR